MCESADQQRVAIGRSFGDEIVADRAAGTGFIVDHDGLAQRFLQFRCDQPRRRVGTTARGTTSRRGLAGKFWPSAGAASAVVAAPNRIVRRPRTRPDLFWSPPMTFLYGRMANPRLQRIL